MVHWRTQCTILVGVVAFTFLFIENSPVVSAAQESKVGTIYLLHRAGIQYARYGYLINHLGSDNFVPLVPLNSCNLLIASAFLVSKWVHEYIWKKIWRKWKKCFTFTGYNKVVYGNRGCQCTYTDQIQCHKMTPPY